MPAPAEFSWRVLKSCDRLPGAGWNGQANSCRLSLWQLPGKDDFLAHPLDDAVPIAAPGLTEQSSSRVPGAVVAVQHPAKIRRIRQQDHYRLAQCAGEMRDGRIDRHDD